MDDIPRWLGPLFGVLAGGMIPWIAYLAITLPAQHVSSHYDAAWVGFDVALVLALVATGWYVWRGRTRVELPATVAATLLLVDGWFDVFTSYGYDEIYVAVISALLLELPLAVLCLWIALHAERVRTHRARILGARAGRRLGAGQTGERPRPGVPG